MVIAHGVNRSSGWENFDEEAEKFLAGEEKCSEAARNCRLSYMIFKNRIQTILKNKFNAEEYEVYGYIQEICQKWKRHELNKMEKQINLV